MLRRREKLALSYCTDNLSFAEAVTFVRLMAPKLQEEENGMKYDECTHCFTLDIRNVTAIVATLKYNVKYQLLCIYHLDTMDNIKWSAVMCYVVKL